MRRDENRYYDLAWSRPNKKNCLTHLNNRDRLIQSIKIVIEVNIEKDLQANFVKTKLYIIITCGDVDE